MRSVLDNSEFASSLSILSWRRVTYARAAPLRLFARDKYIRPSLDKLRDDAELLFTETIKRELDGKDSMDPVRRTTNVYAQIDSVYWRQRTIEDLN